MTLGYLPDQVTHTAPVLALSLRSLAVYIDDTHSDECTHTLLRFTMDKLEYLGIMLPLHISAPHHALTLVWLKNALLLRKLERYLASDKTFSFPSVPKSTDLELFYYPESSHLALPEILALPYFRSITLIWHLVRPLSSVLPPASSTELNSPYDHRSSSGYRKYSKTGSNQSRPWWWVINPHRAEW